MECHGHSLIFHDHLLFHLKRNPVGFEPQTQRVPVNGFEKAGPELAMHTNRATDDRFYLFFRLFIEPCRQSHHRWNLHLSFGLRTFVPSWLMREKRVTSGGGW